MSWGWFDICVCGSESSVDDDESLVPIDAPFEPGDDEYVDHVEEMMSRLVYQLARVP